jgi:hypothetical protein
LSPGGVITGTPVSYGSFTVAVVVTSGSQSATGDLNLYVAPPPVSVSTASLPSGVVGQTYGQYLSATGGTGSYQWSVVSGALPTGLSIVYQYTGYVAGTPTTAGTSAFTVQVTSGGLTATRALTITVLPTLQITTSSLPTGTVGVQYTDTLGASGGTGSYAWSVAGGLLPEGLSLSAAGILSGTPTTQGTSTFIVRVTSGNQSTTQVMSLAVEVQVPPISITTSSLPDGTVGQYYSQYLSATGGTGSYQWGVISGALPTGLSVVYSNIGYIGGTPTVTGTFSFTVQVTSGGLAATRALTITVR